MPLSLVTSNKNIIVNSLIPYNFSLTLTNPIYNTDCLVLNLGNQYTPLYQLISLSGSTISVSNVFNPITFTINSQSSSVLNVSLDRNLSNGDQLYINLSSIFAPPSSGISPKFTLSIYQNGFIKAYSYLSIVVFPRTFTAINTSISNSTILAPSNYQVSFFTLDPIPSTGMIQLLLPSQITVPTSINQLTVNNITAIYSIMGQANGLTIKNLPSIISNSNVTISITNLINPSSTDPIFSQLSIRCYYSNSTTDLISYGSYIPSELTYTGPQTITYIVSSSSQVVMASNVTLTFIILTQIGIPQGGSIKIIIFNMLSYATSTSCLITTRNNQTANLPCQIDSTNSSNN